MIEFANLNQVEALFDEMEPGNQEGGGFTPSLHQDEIRLDDSSIELARIIHNSLQWRLPLPAKTDPTTPGGPEIRCGACRRLQGSQTGRENRLVRAQKHQQDVPLPHDLSPESDPP